MAIANRIRKNAKGESEIKALSPDIAQILTGILTKGAKGIMEESAKVVALDKKNLNKDGNPKPITFAQVFNAEIKSFADDTFVVESGESRWTVSRLQISELMSAAKILSVKIPAEKIAPAERELVI